MNFANKISVFRILSVPFFIACLIYYSPSRDYLRFFALLIFILAVISDAVDGYIARKSRQLSQVGLILDPLADKILLMSAFLCLFLRQDLPRGIYFPLWVVFIILSRDILILLGAIVIFVVKQNISISATKWGKLTTVFQMLSVVAVLLQLSFAYVFWWLAVIFTLISGIDYLMRGLKILYATGNSGNSH